MRAGREATVVRWVQGWPLYLTLALCVYFFFFWILPVGTLAGVDWWPQARSELALYYPLPRLWDSTLGLGHADIWFFYPKIILGWLSHWGASIPLSERIAWFWPALMLNIAGAFALGWVFTRDRFATGIAMLVFVFNPYVITTAALGHITILAATGATALAVALTVEATRSHRPILPVLVGCLLAADISFDLRIAFLAIPVCSAIFIIASIRHRVKARLNLWSLCCALLLAIALSGYLVAVFLFAHTAQPKLPADYSSLSWLRALSYQTLFDSLSLYNVFFQNRIGLIPLGQTHAGFLFVLIPLGVIYAAARRRVAAVWWLAALYLVGAFLAKGLEPPAGFINGILFQHMPGFAGFRDPSKFTTLTMVGAAPLIALAFADMATLPRLTRNAIGAAFVILWLSGISYAFLPSHHFTGIFAASSIPLDIQEANDLISKDSRYGRVLWLPQTNPWSLKTEQHPAITLSDFYSTQLEQALPTPSSPMSLLNDPEFRSLLQISATRYLVVYDPTRYAPYAVASKAEVLDRLAKLKYLDRVASFGNAIVFVVRNSAPLLHRENGGMLINGGYSAMRILAHLHLVDGSHPAVFRPDFGATSAQYASVANVPGSSDVDDEGSETAATAELDNALAVAERHASQEFYVATAPAALDGWQKDVGDLHGALFLPGPRKLPYVAARTDAKIPALSGLHLNSSLVGGDGWSIVDRIPAGGQLIDPQNPYLDPLEIAFDGRTLSGDGAANLRVSSSGGLLQIANMMPLELHWVMRIRALGGDLTVLLPSGERYSVHPGLEPAQIRVLLRPGVSRIVLVPVGARTGRFSILNLRQDLTAGQIPLGYAMPVSVLSDGRTLVARHIPQPEDLQGVVLMRPLRRIPIYKHPELSLRFAASPELISAIALLQLSDGRGHHYILPSRTPLSGPIDVHAVLSGALQSAFDHAYTTYLNRGGLSRDLRAPIKISEDAFYLDGVAVAFSAPSQPLVATNSSFTITSEGLVLKRLPETAGVATSRRALPSPRCVSSAISCTIQKEGRRTRFIISYSNEPALSETAITPGTNVLLRLTDGSIQRGSVDHSTPSTIVLRTAAGSVAIWRRQVVTAVVSRKEVRPQPTRLDLPLDTREFGRGRYLALTVDSSVRGEPVDLVPIVNGKADQQEASIQLLPAVRDISPAISVLPLSNPTIANQPGLFGTALRVQIDIDQYADSLRLRNGSRLTGLELEIPEPQTFVGRGGTTAIDIAATTESLAADATPRDLPPFTVKGSNITEYHALRGLASFEAGANELSAAYAGNAVAGVAVAVKGGFRAPIGKSSWIALASSYDPGWAIFSGTRKLPGAHLVNYGVTNVWYIPADEGRALRVVYVPELIFRVGELETLVAVLLMALLAVFLTYRRIAA